MSLPSEHDYTGLPSVVSSMENSDKGSSTSSPSCGLNLKATELRLGLPGSESPERENSGNHPQLTVGLNSNSNNNNNKSLVSGAKRGFSVAIHGGSGNWVFPASAGSNPEFSPRGANTGKGVNESDSDAALKDGLPQSPKAIVQEKKVQETGVNGHGVAPVSKAQVVGWPPIRSFRKTTMASHPPKNDDAAETKLGSECLYVKVSMDGAPYLRKVDLKTYGGYKEFSLALEKMFSCFTIGHCGTHGVPGREGLSGSRLMDLLQGSEYVLTYEDKDGDWMLVGDVPWKMFTDSCRRVRIMKSSEAIGLAPRALEKSRSRN